MPARSGRRDVVLTFPVDLDAFGDRSMFVRFQGRTLGVPDMLEEFADRADLVIRHVAQRPRIHPLILAHPAQAGRLHSRSLREMTYRGQCSTTSANNPSRCSLAESVGSRIHARGSVQRSVRSPTADSHRSGWAAGRRLFDHCALSPGKRNEPRTNRNENQSQPSTLVPEDEFEAAPTVVIDLPELRTAVLDGSASEW